MQSRLKELRIKRQLKQKDLAMLLEITTATYNRYEKGSLRPDIDKLIMVADFYKVTLDYLMMRSDDDGLTIKTDQK